MPERREPHDKPELSAADIARQDPTRRGLAATNLPPRSILLGRQPMPEDKRDHMMTDEHLSAQDVTDAQLDTSLRDLIAQGFFTNWRQILAFWRWVKPRKPKPPAPKARRYVLCEDASQLDQSATPHCVGFCWSQWHNSEPVVGQYTNADGHAVYYECKVIDGEPNAENGSNTRSGAKTMQNRGRLGEYVFAGSVDEIVAWLLTKKSPVSTGTDWDGPMFTPDSNGYLHPNGNPEGGHEWLIIGYDDGDPDDPFDKEPHFVMQNSWGLGWGVTVTEGQGKLVTSMQTGGRAKITVREYKQLFDRQGDAAAGLELA